MVTALAFAPGGCSPGTDSPGAGDGSGGAAAPGTGGSSATGGGGSGGGTGGSASGGSTGGAGDNTGGASAGGGGGQTDPGTGGTTGSDAAAPVDSGAEGKPDRIPMPTGPGKIVVIAGGGNGGDGTLAAMASTSKPFGAVADPINGDIYIAEYGGHKVRRIDDKGMISTVMGAGATGPGGKITLGQPHNLIFQPNSHILFVADTMAGRVIRMDTTTGESAVFIGGLGQVYCLAFDASGDHLYLTAGGVTIMDVKTMTKTTVNTATPRVIAVDSKSNLYIGGGASLRVADPMGKIMDVMGSGGLAAPKHLNIDLDDNVLIADTESDTIKKYVVATKSVVKIAGGGAGAVGGTPDMVKLARPHGVAVDAQGRILIADSFNDRVLRIDF
jgi:uncharacterized ParB-like nuclease family protein